MKRTKLGNAARGEIVVPEVADMLGLTRPSVMKIILAGDLPAREDDNGHFFVKESDVECYIEQRREKQHDALLSLLQLEAEHDDLFEN